MARARNLKPGFFVNERLGECDPLARLLFQGLWCHADREGRLEWRPRRLKAEILPYDDCDVLMLLKQLSERAFVIAYTIANIEYIQIVNFTKHQNPHMKEAASTIPTPDEPGASTILAGPLPSSLLPLPESLNPISPSTIRVEGARQVRKHFDRWYAIYPRHVGKGAAERAFTKALKLASPETLNAGAAAYAQKVHGEEPRFTAHPATWLNGQRWLDSDAAPLSGSGNGHDPRPDVRPPPIVDSLTETFRNAPDHILAERDLQRTPDGRIIWIPGREPVDP